MGSGPVQVHPSGLLDFLGLKTGRYPSLLGDELGAVIDLWEHYVAQNSVSFAFVGTGIVASTNGTTLDITATTPINLANGVQLVVPANETWYVQHADINWGFDNAGQLVDFGLTHRSSVSAAGVGFMFDLGPIVGYANGAAAPAVRIGRRTLQRPCWLTAGTLIQVLLGGATVPGGTVTFAGSFRVARMGR